MPDTQIVDDRSRRHFLKVAGAAAGILTLALPSKPAVADDNGCGDDKDGDDNTSSLNGQADPTQEVCNCLLRGTKILTAHGPIAIEQLEVGDLIQTESGQLKPIKWIGSRSVKRHPGQWRESDLPIRIGKSAFATNAPSRDLYLSPAHSIFVDGYLIPAELLVNGSSITRSLPPGVDSVEYFHIQFEHHEVMFAEGLAVESMQAAQADGWFGNATVPDTGVMLPYAPILAYRGGRDEVKALLRLQLSKWIDVRDPIQIIYDRLVARAKMLEKSGAISQDRALTPEYV